MLGDFEVVSRPYVPVWRREKGRRKRITAEILMASASLAGLLLVWSPWEERGYTRVAISYQLASGDLAAMSLFLFMGLVLASMAVRLWKADRKPSALLMGLEILALVVLARTHPFALEHLFTFIVLALVATSWLAVLAIDLEDYWLGVVAAVGLGSFLLVFTSMGLGERAMITSCLLGMNVMFFRHFG